MSNQLILAGVQLPSLNLSPEIAAKVQAQFAQAAANTTTSLPRLSFGGKMFNITFGGDTVELQDRVLDVHLVAIDPQFHYTFYEKAYTGTDSDKDGRIMSRYPLPTDDFEFTPTHEWSQRAYKQRAVVMLANDPDHKLYVVDFGYNSIKKGGNPQLGLLNLSQLIAQLDFITRQNPQILPFMFTVQLSFTKASVAEIQFSLYDQRQQGNTQARFATPAAIEAMANAIANGDVDNLMKVEYDSAANKGEAEPAKATVQAQPAPVATPVATPVVQQPVVQPQVVQQPVVQQVQQPVVQPQVVQQPVVQQPVVQQAVAQQQATEELASL